MFKVNNINGDYIESTSSASSVLGGAIHKALEVYYGGNPDFATSADESQAILEAHKFGIEYLEQYHEGLIEYNSTIKDRQHLNEKFAFAFFGYIKSLHTERVKDILIVEKKLKHKVEIDGKVLPVPLVGKPDLVYRNHDNEIIIEDHKITSKFSGEKEIDGAKLVQSAFLFLLIYAEFGEAPKKIVFREFKHTQNKDKTEPQVKEYEIVFAEQPLIFQFFMRLYADITDGLMGKQVYVPNLNAIYDREVSILSYIHRLDVDEDREKAFKKLKVDNIADFLKKKIEKDGFMKKYLDTITTKFISANTLNYKDMIIEDKIKMKLAEHGIGMQFDSKVVGNTVTLYKYEPSVGVKMSKIDSYIKDIEQVLEVSDIRILAPIPHSGLVGFEVPNKERQFVSFNKNKHKTEHNEFAIGIDTQNNVINLTIDDMPHLLVAGTTGSGKTIFLENTIKQQKNKYDLVIIDPKGTEFEQGMSDHKEIATTLSGFLNIMSERYAYMKKNKIKKWSESGKNSTVIIIDEYNDIFSSKEQIRIGTKEVTKVYAGGPITSYIPVYDTVGNVCDRSIKLLAQKARSAGIHIILATQRPSVKVLDGDIKANFPTRISFKLPTITDSKVIIDRDGADKLKGKGDGLLLQNGFITRFQAFNL